MSGTKIDRIKALPMFKKAGDKAIDRLAQAADEVQVTAGREIITQGTVHNEAYVLIDGTAEVLVDGDVVADIEPTEMVGELGFFDPGPASATVRAKSDSRVLILPYNRLDAVLDDNPDLLRSITDDLAARLRAMDARGC